MQRGPEMRSKPSVRWGDSDTIQVAIPAVIGPNPIKAACKQLVHVSSNASPHLFAFLATVNVTGADRGDVIIPGIAMLIGVGSTVTGFRVDGYAWAPWQDTPPTPSQDTQIIGISGTPLPANTVNATGYVTIVPAVVGPRILTLRFCVMAAAWASPGIGEFE
jgi:hypothetical protein